MKGVLIIYLLIKSNSTMAQQQGKYHFTLPFSKVISANDFVFISGQVGIDETTGKLVNRSFEARGATGTNEALGYYWK
jgi:enamine deaminase RidA (YjgF/YER057c/UK114 family)